ncbi:MAG: hypothetical protein J6568_04665 [Snodgrassella sp.]|nr:hypothetical protein [Snodgrassella sp.]
MHSPIALIVSESCDSSHNQRRFSMFNLIDDFKREALSNDITFGLPVVGLPVSWKTG